MKEYHPDVYTGEEDANIIANRLIRAYKVRHGAMPGLLGGGPPGCHLHTAQ